MKFDWNKWRELELKKRNTLQIFITNRCNLNCSGCFARNIMENNNDMFFEEYSKAVNNAVEKGVKQINILGGEPFLHPNLTQFCNFNQRLGLKTTIYTNGSFLYKYPNGLPGAKIRVSIYSEQGNKGVVNIANQKFYFSFDANFMVSVFTSVEEMLRVAYICEDVYKCRVFFIYSMRECDNPNKEFFDDTYRTMPVIEYKKLVHRFLGMYNGNMDIHISKRGVFESTVSIPHNKCKFANYFIGGKIIQCPYDVVNLKYQNDYEFDKRYCQQNNTCLMSKLILRRRVIMDNEDEDIVEKSDME